MPTVESAILIELYFHQIALRWSAVPGSGSGDMRKLNNSIIRFRKQAAKMLRILRPRILRNTRCSYYPTKPQISRIPLKTGVQSAEGLAILLC